jgi:AraC family transcriptional regulator
LPVTLQFKSFIGTHDGDWEDTSFNRHDSVEITLIMDGSGLFRWGSCQFPVDAGQVILIPSDILHSFHAVTAIRFGVLLVDGLPPDIQKIFNHLLMEQQPRIISLSQLDKEQYELLFRQWLRIAFLPLKEPDKTHLAWIQVLLLFLQEHSHSSPQALSTAHIADFIRQNMQMGLQISELAIMAGLTEDGLRKRFLKVYGMTPKHYQQTCRLVEAKWLLNSSDKDMQAIAEMIGFSQLHSFSSWFKDLEGSSPSEWRKSQRLYHN